MGQDIADLLAAFPANGDQPAARIVRGEDGRDVLQLRVSMGVLQMEMEGRPDGERPGGRTNWLEHAAALLRNPPGEEPPEINWSEIDRELMQYYHRRICLLAVGSNAQSAGQIDRARNCFHRAAADAAHNLALMDLIRDHCQDADYVTAHEAYRGFVLFHRTLALSQAALLAGHFEDAIELAQAGRQAIINHAGPDALAEMPDDVVGGLSVEPAETESDESADEGDLDAESITDEDDSESESESIVRQWVAQLDALINQIRRAHNIPRTLREQLEDAINAEDFEKAADLRRKLDARRNKPGEK